MGRIRTAWGLFAFAAMFVAFIVLVLLAPRSQSERGSPYWAARPSLRATTEGAPIESIVAAEVASAYAVPAGTPIVTRVSDAEALAVVNPFYLSVRDGDWLVRYPDLLIAYRQEEGRILAVEQATSTR